MGDITLSLVSIPMFLGPMFSNMVSVSMYQALVINRLSFQYENQRIHPRKIKKMIWDNM